MTRKLLSRGVITLVAIGLVTAFFLLFHESSGSLYPPIAFSRDGSVLASLEMSHKGFHLRLPGSVPNRRYGYYSTIGLRWRLVAGPDKERSVTLATFTPWRKQGCPPMFWLAPDSRHAAVLISTQIDPSIPGGPTLAEKLLVVDLDSEKSWTLVDTGGSIDGVSWFSSDEITIVTRVDNNAAVLFQRTNILPGSKPVLVHRDGPLVMHLLCDGAFSPSGRYTIFGRADNNPHTVLLDLLTGKTCDLAPQDPSFLLLSSWRRDESQAVCVSRGNQSRRVTVTLVDIPSGKATDLSDLWPAQGPYCPCFLWPTWTPDGRYVLANPANAGECHPILFDPNRRVIVPIGEFFCDLLSPGKPFYTKFRILDATGRLLAGGPDSGIWTIDYQGLHVERLADGKPFVSVGGWTVMGSVIHPMVELYPFACVFSPDEKWIFRSTGCSLPLEPIDLSGSTPLPIPTSVAP